MFKKLLDDILYFVFPNLCVLCDNPLPHGRRFVCPVHFDELKPAPEKVTKSLIENISQPCFSDLFVLYQYDQQIRRLIHLLKYKHGVSLADYFAGQLISTFLLPQYDIITGVPLNPARERERGYNQSYLLAKAVAESASTRFEILLSRHKNTRSQTKLNRQQRIQNVSSAFTLKQSVENQKILLIDDIITTGSTLNACAEVLKMNGADRIDVAVVATPVIKSHFELEKTEMTLLDEI